VRRERLNNYTANDVGGVADAVRLTQAAGVSSAVWLIGRSARPGSTWLVARVPFRWSLDQALHPVAQRLFVCKRSAASTSKHKRLEGDRICWTLEVCPLVRSENIVKSLMP
jgi:hypothetical protein